MWSSHRLSVLLAILGIVAVAVGATMFDSGEPETLTREAGKLLLQLGFIGVGGALVSVFVERDRERRRDSVDRHQQRVEVLARLRAAHVRVAYAQRLINAHDTARTYFERCRDLMQVRYELEELATDVEIAGELFDNSSQVRGGISTMVAYLDALADEYGTYKSKIDPGYTGPGQLSEAIEHFSMTRVDEFRSACGSFVQEYEAGLDAAKGAVRRQVFAPRS